MGEVGRTVETRVDEGPADLVAGFLAAVLGRTVVDEKRVVCRSLTGDFRMTHGIGEVTCGVT